MRIDSHQHFWKYDEADYPWIKPEWPIRRDFLPRHLEPELKACGLDGCVAVQARQSLGETQWLLKAAKQSPIVKGVVGWVDLRAANLEKVLGDLAADPKLVGVRHVVQDEPDVRFLLGDAFVRGLQMLHPYGLTYDILIFPKQLPAAIELVRRLPEQAFVVDHLAKPFIKDGLISPWREQMRELAGAPNVCCKVSGLVTEARWQGWKAEDFRPYLEAAFEAFGPDRVMYGSDWPVALLAASYAEVYGLVRDFVQQFGAETEAKFFGENAVRFYDLK